MALTAHALEAQKAREAVIAGEISRLRAELANRIIYSTDFKRRPHYNQTIDLSNNEIRARIASLNAQLEEAAQSQDPALRD